MKEHLTRYIEEGKAPHLRGLRVLLEYFYAADQFRHLRKSDIPVVSVFGSARAQPDSPPYQRAYELGQRLFRAGFSVITGASQGVMQAANQGVADAIADHVIRSKKAVKEHDIRNSDLYQQLLKKYSLGLRITLPFEEGENPWVGTGATFHYFMVRKFFFASLSRAFIACEGGWGTRDELFEMLTLIQTGKAPLMPIIYLSRDPTHLKQDMHHAVKAGYIDREDLHLISIVRQPANAVKIISNFYTHFYRLDYVRRKTIRLYFRKRPTREQKKVLKEIWPRYKNRFMEYRWRNNGIAIVKRPGVSYGAVMRLIKRWNREMAILS